MLEVLRLRAHDAVRWIESAPERRWRQAVLALAAAGLLARLVIIAVRHSGGANLRIYWWFAHLAAHGHNPYHAPVGGPVDPNYGDNQPAEIGLFSLVLRIHDSQTTLRVFIALLEVLFVVGVGFAYPRSRQWRAGFCAFFAVNPFVLLVWTAYTSDKVLVVAPIAAVLAALA